MVDFVAYADGLASSSCTVYKTTPEASIVTKAIVSTIGLLVKVGDIPHSAYRDFVSSRSGYQLPGSRMQVVAMCPIIIIKCPRANNSEPHASVKRERKDHATCFVIGSTSITSSPSKIVFLSGTRGFSW